MSLELRAIDPVELDAYANQISRTFTGSDLEPARLTSTSAGTTTEFRRDFEASAGAATEFAKLGPRCLAGGCP